MKFPILAAIFLISGVASAFFLLKVEDSPRLRPWNQLFLDQLVSTTASQRPTPQVTFLRIRQSDLEKGDLAPRLNWAVLMDSLLHFEPQAAGLVPSLRWDDSDVLTEGALSNRVKKMPPMALGAILSPSSPEAPQDSYLTSFLHFEQISGDLASLPEAKQVAAMPDEELLINGKPAFTHIELLSSSPPGLHGHKLPLICRLGDRIVPSFALQLFMLQEGLLPDDVVIRLDGPRSSAQIGDNHRVPLDASGRMEIHHGLTNAFPQIDFASLVLAVSPFQEVAEELRKATEDELESLRTNAVVVGFDEESLRDLPLPDGTMVSRAHLLSMALAALHSGFHITPWNSAFRYGSWGALALLCLLALSFPRWLSFASGIALAALYLAVCWVVFQQNLSWTPPWIALSLCSLTIVLGTILPRKASRRRR